MWMSCLLESIERMFFNRCGSSARKDRSSSVWRGGVVLLMRMFLLDSTLNQRHIARLELHISDVMLLTCSLMFSAH